MATLSYQTSDDADQYIAASIDQAQNRIAPTWPLDQFIAVNPYWGWSTESFSSVAKKLWQLANSPLTMPRGYFLEEWNNGRFGSQDLKAVIGYANLPVSPESLEATLHSTARAPETSILVSQLVDRQCDLSHSRPWQQFVKHQISQHCAAYFDRGQAKWHPDQSTKLYDSWKQQTACDKGPLLQFGFKRFEQTIRQLPDGAENLIRTILPQMGIRKELWPDYLTALQIDINGWSAWCSYIKWQAQLVQQQSDQIVQLTAIRLAWEWVLLQQHPTVRQEFVSAWSKLNSDDTTLQSECAINELLLHAMEHAYQKPLAMDLLRAQTVENNNPDFQAVFCIDVRSEVFRRALEKSHPKIETRGFAGFFGLPVAYRERGSASTRPQLPGLLAPKYWVSEFYSSNASDIRRALADECRWQDMRQSASSAFTFVETLGLAYGAKLVRNTIAAHRLRSFRKSGNSDPQEVPKLMLYSDAALSEPVSLHEQAVLAKQILIAMGLRKNFARLILLAGHGAACTNNPHAASLDCGACGGQNGAINARLLADMLNNPKLRDLLRNAQIDIPDTTQFIGGLHNTTTDHVQLYNPNLVPQSHRADVLALQSMLGSSAERARVERAPSLGINSGAPGTRSTEDDFNLRAQDWSQIRQEWGLANNAALIVAPRSRSRALNLKGRAFLHDYEWQSDDGFAILELIMTAPMVVTNWINMQYYASTVDAQRYGSGSKILHNVVGQRLGVFEGNGGDLRIGLPWQSIHNGSNLMHTPLRLSVMIEAPRKEITSVLKKHATLNHLVNNRWLHLFQIDAQENKIYYYNQKKWIVFAENTQEDQTP